MASDLETPAAEQPASPQADSGRDDLYEPDYSELPSVRRRQADEADGSGLAERARLDFTNSFYRGTLAGSLMSPESYAGWAAKGATWLTRTLKAAVQQGGIQAAVDPIVQYLNRQAGTEQGYDPWRTVQAASLGAVIGGMELLCGTRRTQPHERRLPSPSKRVRSFLRL